MSLPSSWERKISSMVAPRSSRVWRRGVHHDCRQTSVVWQVGSRKHSSRENSDNVSTPRRDVHGEHDDKPPEARLDVPTSDISRENPHSTKFDV
ncbi:hypothetical protein BD309DRAFT_483577 [Dichomitus squalens]|nr:hypothetical protein BD309DRAFT_483577 [Dichomitus squalens]